MRFVVPSRVALSIVLALLLIAVFMFWVEQRYQRMIHACETMGGKFYSISFTQNICVDGRQVRELD
jgi:predicted membrane protein